METLLSPLINSAESVMIYFNTLGFSWGMCIIIMAILLRILILPATIPQMHQVRKFKSLNLEVNKIKEKFSTDSNQLTRELMRVYSKNKANVFGLMLPILVQAPFYAALFFLLRSDEFKADIGADASFLFIDNLTSPIREQFLALVLLLLIYFFSQIAASLAGHDLKNKTTNIIALTFAILGSFAILALNFPTGLVLFWIVGNFWLLGQNIILRLMPAYPVTSFQEIYDKEGPADESFGLPSFLSDFQSKQQNLAKQLKNAELNKEYLSELKFEKPTQNEIKQFILENNLTDNLINYYQDEQKLNLLLDKIEVSYIAHDNKAIALIINNKLFMYVAEDSRNKGIGNLLLELIENDYKDYLNTLYTTNKDTNNKIIVTQDDNDFYKNRKYILTDDLLTKEFKLYKVKIKK